MFNDKDTIQLMEAYSAMFKNNFENEVAAVLKVKTLNPIRKKFGLKTVSLEPIGIKQYMLEFDTPQNARNFVDFINSRKISQTVLVVQYGDTSTAVLRQKGQPNER